MILAHNKSILKYIHDVIKHRGIATVGYYIGGMKEEELQKSEGKTVIIFKHMRWRRNIRYKIINNIDNIYQK